MRDDREEYYRFSPEKRCLECSWMTHMAADDRPSDVAERAIAHFLETGHTIESEHPVSVSFE